MGLKDLVPCGHGAAESPKGTAEKDQPATPSTIPAIVVENFGPPEVLKLAEKPLPELQSGEVLVDIKASGINPSDTYIRLGPEGPYAAMPGILPKLPYTPGKDGAGVIEAIGADVTGFNVRDRVYTTNSVTGTAAAKAICKAANVYHLPEEATFAQGACIGIPCTTAYYALKTRGQVRAAEKVLIHGASGAVGLAAIQFAKKMVGPEGLVVGTAGTEEGEKATKDAGIDVVVNHRKENYVNELKEAAPGGYDLILEMFAHINLAADLGLAARRGRICIIGSRSQEIAVNPRHFMASEVDVRGVFLGKITPEENQEAHAAMRSFLSDGSLKPVVALELKLAEAALAHKEVMEPSAGGASGNIVLVP
mmetsp:Transcript_80807/g.168605  ORF Transcript_80807/g.168605 Transcript_80807/m.168605 type:complete len:365 (+) Transcript_80807:322-1416(+)